MTDLTVIGAGAAGCRAALLAAASGFSVTLIESETLGGASAREGYALYRPLLRELRAPKRHGDAISDDAAYASSWERARQSAADGARAAREMLTDAGVETVRAAAHVTGLKGRRYVVTTGDCFYESKRLLLAAGSVPAIPDAPDIKPAIESGFVITTAALPGVPRPMRALIIGGTSRDLGVAAFLAANQVSVTLASPWQTVAEDLDADVCRWLSERLPQIRMLCGASLASLTPGHATLALPEGGRGVHCDRVVIGGRRAPAAKGLAPAKAGIATDALGAVITDMTGRTNLPDVWAAGDVNGRTQSSCGAYREAEVCVSNMLGAKKSVPYHALPRVYEGIVKAACSGAGESDLKNTKVASAFVRNRYEEGFVKLVADSGGALAGAHVAHESESVDIIYSLAKLIERRAPVSDVLFASPPASAVSDAVFRAALQLIN